MFSCVFVQKTYLPTYLRPLILFLFSSNLQNCFCQTKVVHVLLHLLSFFCAVRFFRSLFSSVFVQKRFTRRFCFFKDGVQQRTFQGVAPHPRRVPCALPGAQRHGDRQPHWHRCSRRARCVCEAVDGNGFRSEQRRGVLGRFGDYERPRSPGHVREPRPPSPRGRRNDSAPPGVRERARGRGPSGSKRRHCARRARENGDREPPSAGECTR
jgi:hypothetical protein